MRMFLVVYDEGSIYSPDILDIKPEDLLGHFMAVSCAVLTSDSLHFYPNNHFSRIKEHPLNMAEKGFHVNIFWTWCHVYKSMQDKTFFFMFFFCDLLAICNPS